MSSDEDDFLRHIAEGTAGETGLEFFKSLAQNLAMTLQVSSAWVTEYFKEEGRIRAFAFWLDGQFIPDYEYLVEGTPCEVVVEEARLVHIPENVIELFPRDPVLKSFSAMSYLGVPLIDADGKVLGHIAVLDRHYMSMQPRVSAVFRIFAARAAAELRRLRSESALREKEEKLSRVFQSALDAIIELDEELKVTRINPAGEQIFGAAAGSLLGVSFLKLLTSESRGKLTYLINQLPRISQRYLWIRDGLNALRSDGESFPAEGTLSQFEAQHRTFYSVILRDVNERLKAEGAIQSLSSEMEYLRDQVRSIELFDAVLGESPAILKVLDDVRQVAGTDSTVLLLGETGTGKGLFASVIHAASNRKNKPFIKVNCAAIPASLMESEFFGHEKGAFTGATERREGRFALADGGTLFLDEIGELPTDLQVKLLRVLQEGEFEPVGSSHTRKVNVRLIAATNRDLKEGVQQGKFREDLYFRLNVFPIEIPPLRRRIEDIEVLASALTKKLAVRLGRQIAPLSSESIFRLRRYDWPGNVRELQNVIERAIITSKDGGLNLDRALPESSPTSAASLPVRDEPAKVRSAMEMMEMEKANLLRALERTNWRVAGPEGAAALLGVNPSTLSSRLKVLKMKRPR